MPHRYKVLAPPALAAVLALLVAFPAHATWPNSPSVNLPVCRAANHQQNPVVCSDGAGGMIVAWEDYRAGNWDIYAQRVAADGTVLWTTDGVGICIDPGSQSSPSILASDDGGAVIAWKDARGAIGYGASIYAQRVDAQGGPQWTANGTPIVDGTCIRVSGEEPPAPRMASDGVGGVLFTWTDSRPNNGSYRSIYTQRVDSSGASRWMSEGALVRIDYNAYAAVVAPDGAGGAYIAYHYHNGAQYVAPVFHMNTIGQMDWSVFADVNTSEASLWPELLPDGAGGVFVMWSTYLGGSGFRLVGQHITAERSLLWSPYGMTVCASVGSTYRGFKIAPNGLGGFYAVWPDARNGYWNIYAENMTSGGQTLWGAVGLAVSAGSSSKTNPAIAVDGTGGILLAWNDNRNGPWDIYAQRLDVSGQALWTANGALVSNAGSDQMVPTVVSDEHGRATIAWHDYRNNNWDIFAQSFDPRPAIAGAKDIPNDQGGQLRLAWDACYYDTDPRTDVDTYRIWREVPAAVATGAMGAVQAGTARPDDGAASFEEVTPVFRTSEFAGVTYYWELLTSVGAVGHAGYSCVVATTGDSIAGSNPYTLFMVEARNSSTGLHWDSDPDSGYSVDNLPPGRPDPFVADYVQNRVNLSWGQNTEPDFSVYRLYCGADRDFVPDPSNRIATLTNTWYVDQVDRPSYAVYKLSAVDVHGNESLYNCASVDGPTPILASLVSATCEGGAARLTWLTTAGPGLAATVQRRSEAGSWEPIATIRAESGGMLRYTDTALEPGQRYGYRLGIQDGAAPAFYGEAWVSAPALQLSLAGALPNPARDGRLIAHFTLPGARPATLELVSPAGRLLATREVGSLGPGSHAVDLAERGRLSSGVYVLRLTQDGRSLIRRVVVLR